MQAFQALEDIKRQIAALGAEARILRSRELEALPGILEPNEIIERIIQGTAATTSKNVLLVATDRRLLLVSIGGYQIKPDDLAYNKVSDIEIKAGMLLAKITIRAPGIEAEVINLDKGQARAFARYAQQKVTSVQASQQASHPVGTTNDAAASTVSPIPPVQTGQSSAPERWCARCGKRCGMYANFCEYCGAALASPTASALPPAPAPPAAPADATEPGRGQTQSLLIPTSNTTDSTTNSVNIWRLIAHHEIPAEAAEWSHRQGVIAVGWGGTGDLHQCIFRNEVELTRLVSESHPGVSVSNYVHGGRSLWRLYREVQPGDLVIVSAAGARVVTMRVTGDYYYVSGDYPITYEHRRPAERVPIDPDHLWRLAGGPAVGENVRRTLIRCAHTISAEQMSVLFT